MDINYLFSMIKLYLNKELDNKTILNLNKIDNNIEITLSINKSKKDRTSFIIENIDELSFKKLIKMYKENNIIIDEKYQINNQNIYYLIMLSNGRIISFNNYTVSEISNIRNIIYNINNLEINCEFDDNGNEVIKHELSYGFVDSINIFNLLLYSADCLLILIFILKMLLK